MARNSCPGVVARHPLLSKWQQSMPKDAFQASTQPPREPRVSEGLPPRKSEVAWQTPRSSQSGETTPVPRRSLRADDSWCAQPTDQDWGWQNSWEGYEAISQARASVQNRYPATKETSPSRHQSDGRPENRPTLPPTKKRRHWLLKGSEEEADKKDGPTTSPRKWSSVPEGIVKTMLQQQEQRRRRSLDDTEAQRFDLTLHDTDDDEADFFTGGSSEGRARQGDMKDSDKVGTMDACTTASGTLAAPKRECRRRSGEAVAEEECRAAVMKAANGDETDKDWQTVAKEIRDKLEARRISDKTSVL